MKQVTKLCTNFGEGFASACSSAHLRSRIACRTRVDCDSCALATSATACAMKPENRIAQFDAGLSPNIMA